MNFIYILSIQRKIIMKNFNLKNYGIDDLLKESFEIKK